MKNYDRYTYQAHLSELPKCHDPFSVECYLRGTLDIANGFNTEEQAAGILDKNDMVQECYVALIEAWSRIDWDDVKSSDEPQARIWAFLKKSIKLKARERIHNTKDGIRIPHSTRWDITETKNVDDFLTQLFPPEFFSENDENLGLLDDEYIGRYDIMILGEALADVMRKYLSHNEQLVLEWTFGVDRAQLSTKDIAIRLNMTDINVRKIKSRAIEKLDTEEVKNYLKTFYEF